MHKDLQEKYNRLISIIKECGKIAVAFSGGVDSAFLLYAAKEAVGADSVIAITANMAAFPDREMVAARKISDELGVRRIEMDFDQLSLPCFLLNPADRCYHCKKALFTGVKYLAKREGFEFIADGTNFDDLSDYRPGLRALEELKIKSPLKEAGLIKQDIRDISREFGLTTWDKPSIACLASRVPYGEPITSDKLKKIEDAENLLLNMGFREVRVRFHENSLARIEVSSDQLQQLLENREEIISHFREIGFIYITMDMAGFRSGNMNEVTNL